MTLDEVLASPQACLKLWKYAQKENNSENIEFLLLVRTINPALGAAGLPLFPNTKVSQSDRVKYVYERCIVPTANLVLTAKVQDAMADAALQKVPFSGTRWGRSGTQINLPSPIQEALISAYEKGTLIPSSFLPAYQDILKLVRRDLWKRYLDTPEGAGLAAITLPLKPTVIHLPKKRT